MTKTDKEPMKVRLAPTDLAALTDQELNLLVAERVMGWDLCDDPWNEKFQCNLYNEPHQTPLNFSGDAEAMFSMVARMLSLDPKKRVLSFQLHTPVADGHWLATFQDWNVPYAFFSAVADTPMRAVAEAAVLAMR